MHSFISTTIQESSSKVVDLMHKVFYTSCRQQLARKPSCAWLATSVGREKADVAPRKAVGIRTTDGPSLRDFMRQQQPSLQTSPVGASSEENRAATAVPYLSESDLHGRGRRVYFETYGCQMNVNDTEVAWSILRDSGYKLASSPTEADVILAVTCAIRDNAEKKVWSRLDYFKSLKRSRSRDTPPLKVGVLGCMAERLKRKLLESDKMVDLVAGPDAYRDLPRLLSVVQDGQSAVNVALSVDETYADVMPVRMKDSISAFVSIMRGCENMCSFCIVPFTRGLERSRPIESILEEVQILSDQGVKEVTLLGQNVNSYRDLSLSSVPITHTTSTQMSHGFSTIYRPKEGGRRFADLLDKVSQVDPEMRVRFTSPHPKDFPDELLHVVRERPNVCCSIHLPVQSGSSKVLERMRRGYTRETYLELVDRIRSIVPDVTLSSDFIAGFCGETEADHEQTLSLMELVQFDSAYLFAYSMRKKTHAYHHYKDDVPEEDKQRRLRELVTVHRRIASEKNAERIGSEQLVLIQGPSKRSNSDFASRSDGNIKVIVPDVPVATSEMGVSSGSVHLKPGDYVSVKITEASMLSLKGIPLMKTTLQGYHSHPYDVMSA